VLNATREALTLTVEARPASASGRFLAHVDELAGGSLAGRALLLAMPLVALTGLVAAAALSAPPGGGAQQEGDAGGEVVLPTEGSRSVVVAPGQTLRFRLGGGGRGAAALVTALAPDGGPLSPPRVLFERVPVEPGCACRIGE
jgi:hypothetical protein